MLLFSNGGARKKKGTKKARVIHGRLSPPVDVRSTQSVPALEKLLEKGPLTLVLVYADWCGACHRFKENTWNSCLQMNNRTMNIASVREDMINNTSLANAKISHYPSLLLVGKDKRPAEFVSPEGESTNALPNDEKNNVKEILQTPVEEIPEVTTAQNLTIAPVQTAQNLSTDPEVIRQNTPYPEAMAPEPEPVMSPLEAQETLAIANTTTNNARPPNANLDLKTTIQNANRTAQTPLAKPIIGGARMNVGGLYGALTEITAKGLPAALLAAGTQAFVKRSRRRRTRKVRGQKRNKFGRFSRRR